ncbi:MAG: aminotransferase class V-fold PLP-dependent enzyme [Thermaceae bacterium]
MLLTPGPTPIHESVQNVLLSPMRAHLDPEVLKVNRLIQERLYRLFDPGEGALVAALAGSGSLGMEAAFANLKEGPVLILETGVFSARMTEMSRIYGLDTDVLSFPPGEPVRPEQVKRVLRQRRYRLVAMVHGETSTGVLNPAEEVGALVAEEGALFMVDAVTTLGMLPFSMRALRADYAFTGSQKCLSAPPGLAPFALSERGRAELRGGRAWYMDFQRVAEHWERGGYHHTTPVLLHYALLSALDRALSEGIEERAKRVRTTFRWLLAELEERGFSLYPKESPLPTVLVVRPPKGVEAEILKKALYQEGYQVAGGIGPNRGQVLRLGLMGEQAYIEVYKGFLEALDRVLQRMKTRA